MSWSQRSVVTTSPISNDADVFPVLPGEGFFAKKSPVWATTLKRAASGREVRYGAFAYPRWEWTVGYEAIRNKSTLKELSALYGFFGNRGGKFTPFYFQDPDDNVVVSQSFGTGDGTTTVFQLQRTVGVGIYAYNEPVLVCYGLPTIYVNGTPTSTTLGLNGYITFSTAPASGAPLTWSGSYLFLCRFDQDMVDPAQFTAYHWSLGALNFVSLKA